MIDEQKVYIVREYFLSDEAHWINISEESVFSSLKEAKEYLKTLIDLSSSDYYLESLRIGITEYAIGVADSCLREWTYSIKGELVNDYQESDRFDINCIEIDDYEPKGKYEVGDIVFIVPRIKNKLSPSVRGTYGVVVEVPLTGREWIEAIKGEGDLIKGYTIYYINKNGFF